jgi:hypothetical protein
MISDYENKKLIEYLEPGKKVLIRFGHGLGDTLMFMPLFYYLKILYPQTQIDIYLECGQEKIFKSVKDKEGYGYDHVFHIDYRMSEGTGLTKNEKCCLDELGLKIEDVSTFDVVNLKKYYSPFVAVHFQGTALPNAVNCPEDIAYKIWKEILEAGKIPIECHFQHCFHNPVNGKYSFIDRDVRNCRAEIESLIGLIQSSFAFIGVASGPFVIALSVMPGKTLYLEKDHALETYTKRPLKKLNIKVPYNDGFVKEWLNELSK